MNYDDDMDPNDVQAEAIAVVFFFVSVGVLALGIAGVLLWGLWKLAEWALR